MLVRPPGVYRADGDTSLLISVLRAGGYAAGRHVVDIASGTGALALAAAHAGAASVTAVDLSLRSVVTTWLNSHLHGVAATVRRGDLFAPVAGQRFDLIVTNPPYVPAFTCPAPRHRIGRCWDAGPDGRAVLNRICADGPDMLSPGGMLLLVHSTVSNADDTLRRLTAAGLGAEILARSTVPFGPVMRDRAAMLEARGLISPGQRFEELVVIGARRAY